MPTAESSSPGGERDVNASNAESDDVAVLLSRYQQAWADGDVDGIVAMTAPDCVYEASFGPQPWGQRFVGPEEIRAALREMGVGAPGRARHEYVETHIIGDRAFAKWHNVEDGPDGPTVTMHGADFYEFRDGMVTAKIAYRKTVQA
jgi:ketosteroid isomerase-like protein